MVTILADIFGMSRHVVPEVLDWCPAKRTHVMSLLDPAFEAFGVKIMPRITPQLRNNIVWFVINEANDAIGLMVELIWVVLDSRETGQYTWNLCIRHWVYSSRHLSPSGCTVPHECVQAWHGTKKHEVHEH